ncbi:MAG: hypothetical protein ACRDKS_07495 [Actinomycetota bacterium]
MTQVIDVVNDLTDAVAGTVGKLLNGVLSTEPQASPSPQTHHGLLGGLLGG